MRSKGMLASHLMSAVLALPVALTAAPGAQILHRQFHEVAGAFSQNARSTSETAGSQLKVPCKEPPGLIVPKPAPERKYLPGEKVVSAEGGAGKPVSEESVHSNYLRLYPVKSLLVSDSRGRSEDPFGERPTGQNLNEVFYDYSNGNSVMISAPVDETYTVTFQVTGETTATINLVRGQNNQFPDMAMRYNNLVMPPGVTGMLKLTAQGIEPLRLDKDGDGTFETTIEPDAAVEGAAARDLHGPTICFGETKRGATSLVTIAAADSSGVRVIYYSLDEMKKDGMRFQIYHAPFEVDAARTPVVYAFADDRIGNRSGFYDFKLKR